MFAILGDVRNGKAFAGIVSGDGFDPMSSQRGIPEDVTAAVRDHALSNEHSATWVTLDEILAYDWRRTTAHYGIVSAKEFERWDRVKEWYPQPQEYSGDIMGPHIVKVDTDAMRQHVKEVMGDRPFEGDHEAKLKKLNPNMYTRVSWVLTYAASGSQVWEKILPHMLPLGVAHGFENVRLVMDFDS